MHSGQVEPMSQYVIIDIPVFAHLPKIWMIVLQTAYIFVQVHTVIGHLRCRQCHVVLQGLLEIHE